MPKPKVRTDVGEPGEGEWIDQGGGLDGESFVREIGLPGLLPRLSAAETISTTALKLANRVGSDTVAQIFVQTAAIRYRFTGESPTTTVGIVADPGDFIELENAAEVQGFRAIRRDGIDAVLEVSYGRRV